MINNNVEERDQWEKTIRSKLIDFEADTHPDDWKAIESRILARKVVFSRKWYYAAAVITLFLLMTGGYYYYIHIDEAPMVAQRLVEEAEEAINNYESRITNYETGKTVKNIENREAGEAIQNYETAFGGSQLRITNSQNRGVNYGTGNTGNIENTLISATVNTSTNILSLLPHSPKKKLEVKHNHIIPETILSLKQLLVKRSESAQIKDVQYIADATPLKTIKKTNRRWTIGAGGGSYSVGANGGFVNIGRTNYAVSTMNALDNGAWYMETPIRRNDDFNDFLSNASNLTSEYNEASISRVDVSHKQPISLGIGVGYVLNDRWSLQSGLVYTLLKSEWKTSLDVPDKYKQQLHFVGVPLGISYKIAEWNKIRFYATTGGMVEWNAGGNIKTQYYYNEDDAYRTEKEYIRMKELHWSVNARIGATYPVIKFVNAYVEGGANYYFSNNSLIETIRSDKPFHVSLQAGLRFGF